MFTSIVQNFVAGYQNDTKLMGYICVGTGHIALLSLISGEHIDALAMNPSSNFQILSVCFSKWKTVSHYFAWMGGNYIRCGSQRQTNERGGTVHVVMMNFRKLLGNIVVACSFRVSFRVYYTSYYL